MKIRSSRRQFLQASAGAVGAALAVKGIRLEACHMANESCFQKRTMLFDPATETVKS
jgi:hypothetical protein